MISFSFQIPTLIHFGAGKLNELASIPLPGKKAIIVTGGTSIKKLGYLDRVRKILAERGVEQVVFDGVVQNPTKTNVIGIVTVIRQQKCDFVIGLGGGSSIDAAKAAAMMAVNPGDLWDYVQVGQGGKQAFPERGLPLVAIPTTAGTGTEGNPTSVITNEATGEKVGLTCNFPVVSLVDPELMLNIPPQYTAWQGFDALFHCIEAFIAKRAVPISDPLALEGIRHIFANLPEAVNNGGNLEARANMAWGSTLGGMVICMSSCTTAHNIEHSLSGIKPALAHGAGLILFSSAFHRHGGERIPERYAVIADALGVSAPGQTVVEKKDAFLAAFEKLKQDAGVADLRLSNYGFTEADFDEIIHGSHVIAGGPFNRDVYEITDEDLRDMLRASL